jgi:hypothetical protein
VTTGTPSTPRGLRVALATASLVALVLATLLAWPRAGLRPVHGAPPLELDEPPPAHS